MTSVRFATVSDLYDAFPTARRCRSARAREPSLTFLQSLVEERVGQAVSFCAYLLPRREAVWWGCQSLRALRHPYERPRLRRLTPPRPGSTSRTKSRARGARARKPRRPGLPATWMALAAGWSGGSIAPPEMRSVPPAPYQTARAIRAGLLIAMAATPNDEQF